MKKLVILLIDCENLLRQIGENYWANQLLRAIKKLENKDIVLACNEILMWYGGMGSFNDLIISRLNGHMVDEIGEDTVNNKLNVYKSKIYDLTKKIQDNDGRYRF